MGDWVPAVDQRLGGRFQLVMHKLTKGGTHTDVTRVRGAATQLTSYSSSDPFGDSTAVFAFPSITAFDDLDSPELTPWLANYADVDLYWLPAFIPEDDGRYDDGRAEAVINPLTNRPDAVAPAYLRDEQGNITTPNRLKVWEGFVASMEFAADGNSNSLTLQCQGALFQLDHYLQKPFYPARPWPLEKLIEDVFRHAHKPHLRTKPLIVDFPDGWTKRVPKYQTGSANVYSPVAKPGTLWTGLASRNTGSWEHSLTGFVQDQLSLMIVDNDSGVTPGNQWTIAHQHGTVAHPQSRQPILRVRDRFRAPDLSVWVSAPGVEVSLSADSTQSENIIYGDGTDVNGQTWRNAVINENGSRTDYLPLAASRRVYPPKHNPGYVRHAFASEAYVKFGAGFAQPEAVTIAEQQLIRDEQPGWSGTITLSIDPRAGLSRWLIRAGMTILVKGFLGTGETGIPFHIASVEASPMQGTIQLTVDTRYRDLLTVGESLSRNRDPLNPVRMLQVNKTSVLIEDIQAPWDYKAGSGFIPKKSKDSYAAKPGAITFPYTSWTRRLPPLHHPHLYVKVNAAAKTRRARWTRAAILTSERGTISRSEFFAVDVYGRLLKVPFHVSIYSVNVTVSAMPRDGKGPSPYIDGAFESVNPATGQAWPAGNFYSPDQSFIIGWGNRAGGVYNRAGFSPGSEAEGGNPTGMLVDDSTWTFDNTDNPNYNKQAKPGTRQDRSAITLWAMFYCEWDEPVYFQGRLFRQNQGAA